MKPASELIHVLIVEDSKTMGNFLRSIFEEDPRFYVVDVAIDAVAAKKAVLCNRVDVMTLDVELPGVNGIDFLKVLMSNKPIPVVMVGSNTTRGAKVSLDALEAGAVDILGKPQAASMSDIKLFRAELLGKVLEASRIRISMRQLPKISTMSTSVVRLRTDLVVGIGASTGGPAALKELMSTLPASFPPVLIVQHIPTRFAETLAERLDAASNLNVKMAVDGAELKPSNAYLAPGDAHIEVVSENNKLLIKTIDSERVNGHLPSVDVLFNSMAKVLSRKCIGVLLTGMGVDGAKGLLAMREAGAHTICQDEETSVVYGMPRVAFQMGAAVEEQPLEGISRAIKLRLSSRSKSNAKRGKKPAKG
ncbi:MAG: chemotaxis-specific protein-glutamate methyltransferase CheB [Planctomycetes bacterium]|nr:chemotaxis-specific protein-glutamate methyltransferase CheB [Planctomycetota bacterium]